MTHKEYFTNRINVFDVPKLNKEQFLYILKIISLEGEISALDQIEDKVLVSGLKQQKIKEFNRLTRRKKPEEIYKKLVFLNSLP
ncbi:hypothetical protein [Polaribacter marinivivus]|uniref:hypothetical protein n=1 Tax=Polaribacter marinivivus TaxID=1524260 RepID=UPI003D352F3A